MYIIVITHISGIDTILTVGRIWSYSYTYLRHINIKY